MVKQIFFMLLIIMVLSCHNQHKSDNTKLSDDISISQNIAINNSKLREEILNFSENNGEESNILRLTRQRKVDTVIYEISFINEAIDLMPSKISPIHSWFNLEQYIVCVTFDFNDNFITMNEATALKLIKQKFPNDYQYYLENKMLPVPDTGFKKILKLTFVDDELIKKKSYKR